MSLRPLEATFLGNILGTKHAKHVRVLGQTYQTASGWTVPSWDSYKEYTYVGTLDGLYQHTLIATGTRLGPVEAAFLGHILGTKPTKNMRV